MKRDDSPTSRIQEINHGVSTQKDLLLIYLLTIDVIPAKKFVRKREKRTTISRVVVGEYKIEIPFTERRWTEKVWRDYSKFHQDHEEVEVSKYEKKYSEPELTDFINEKVLFHQSQLNPHL